jgi:hypothetical protein
MPRSGELTLGVGVREARILDRQFDRSPARFHLMTASSLSSASGARKIPASSSAAFLESRRTTPAFSSPSIAPVMPTTPGQRSTALMARSSKRPLIE